MIILPDYIITAMSLLEKAGFEAHAVGGCVRDSLMGNTPHDWDMTTNARFDEMQAVFADFKTLDIGKKHGTLTVLIDGKSIEITTYRIDGQYADNRHPTEVTFCTSLEEDLSRRDFTVNALAYNTTVGITDKFNGITDLESRTIRCVGNADKRFNEDALRIIRALRFASVLNFRIEKETADSIHRNRLLLKNISHERVFSELKKLLLSDTVFNVLMNYHDVLSVMIPEIEPLFEYDQKNHHHAYDLWEHTARAVSHGKKDVAVRLALLFHDCGKPLCRSFDADGEAHYYSHASISTKKAKEALTRLRCDNKTLDEVCELIRLHDSPLPDNEKLIKRRLNQLGKETLFKLIDIQRSDNAALGTVFSAQRKDGYDECEKLTELILDKEECFSLKALAVNGNDIAAMGFTGKKIGEILNALLEAVIDSRCENERKSLLDFCAEMYG